MFNQSEYVASFQRDLKVVFKDANKLILEWSCIVLVECLTSFLLMNDTTWLALVSVPVGTTEYVKRYQTRFSQTKEKNGFVYRVNKLVIYLITRNFNCAVISANGKKPRYFVVSVILPPVT